MVDEHLHARKMPQARDALASFKQSRQQGALVQLDVRNAGHEERSRSPIDRPSPTAGDLVQRARDWVDTPPNDTRTLQDTARQSHVLIVPLLPGAGEMDRLQETVNDQGC